MKNLPVDTLLALPLKSLSIILFMGLILSLQAYAADPLPNNTALPGADPAKLVGRWLRPDGGYILQLSDPKPDGRLTAAYFNPRPIYVARAEWQHKDGYIGAFVELRAPNYPGSTYTLLYDPTRDRLVGIYFQAAMQQQFEVAFERTP